ncbi:response regulator receiver domain-containing protein [Hypnocyclicus thermotrophus]|uniref:histidine kinase n=1 Tax=Hypnocyclicus thermotrophus TaxID=1627895 RepID=A0AA46I576_9FUSO|nr:hybrid sensor histidine kinase/response regulator [Hypnocyclicus thermotrophus]TDT68590.1 response regulator receiver domain-containing protein [Hypnocyclicus thermotrophus]
MEINKKILLIDDQKEILESMKNLLSGQDNLKIINNKLDDLLSDFFEEEKKEQEEEKYQVDIAEDGQTGYNMVKKALERDEPYSVVTIDMRMPGWDGLRTAKEIRKIDENIEIVIITAYTDRNRKELVKKIGKPEKLLYLKKPFEREEILQIIMSLTIKWSLEKKVQNQFHIIKDSNNKLEKIIESISNIEEKVISNFSDICKVVLTELKALFDFEELFIFLENNIIKYDEKTEVDFNYKNLIKIIDTNSKFIVYNDYLITKLGDIEDVKLDNPIIAVIKFNKEKFTEKERKYFEIFITHVNNFFINSNLYIELEKKNKELVQSNIKLKLANELKRKFLVTSSHELRTPTSLLLAYSEILFDKNYRNKEKILKKIFKVSLRINELIEKMFNALTTEDMKESIAQKIEKTKLKEMYEEVKSKVEIFLEKRNQKFIYINETSYEEIHIDKHKIINFVLYNLVVNAIKFSEDGEIIIFRVKEDIEKNKILISIEDKGIGISNEDIENIFKPLFVGGEENKHHSGIYEYKSKGLGLGLTIAKNVIDSMKEEIYCKSNLKSGTVVTFTLTKQT